jgi:hypothetical protein
MEAAKGASFNAFGAGTDDETTDEVEALPASRP